MPGTPIEFHLDPFPKSPKAMTRGREGIWWLPRDSVKDWLILSNTSDTSCGKGHALRLRREALAGKLEAKFPADITAFQSASRKQAGVPE